MILVLGLVILSFFSRSFHIFFELKTLFHALSAKSVKVNLKYDFLIAQRTQCPIVIEIRIDKIDKGLCHDMKTKGMLLS